MQPRDYQQQAINSLFNYFQVNTGNPIIAMPTGTGKSIVIGGFLHQAFAMFPTMRVLMLTHVKELIGQNAEKLMAMWPNAPLGIHSAGLKRRDVNFPIIFGGIQSIIKYIDVIGFMDLLIIDEAHLLSPNGDAMYQQLIAALRAFNPRLKIIGLTATPWRQKQGRMTNAYITGDGKIIDPIFTDICFDATTIDWFDWFFNNNYLVKPISKRMYTQLDVSDVRVQGGEYAIGQLQAAVDKETTNEAALRELVEYGYDRRSWLIFASGVDHADHLAEILRTRYGIAASALHSRMESEERDKVIRQFKAGDLRCLCNNNIFTTGQDHPPIDLIGMLRPTQSTGLWVQMIGRGMRPSGGKENCLVLDFAGNTVRLGPINDPVIPGRKTSGAGDAPVKICEKCGTYNHARAAVCEGCGAPFEFETKITRNASFADLIRTEAPIYEWFDVMRCFYDRHIKKSDEDNPNATPILRVRYACGARQFSEWIAFEGQGYARKKAIDWWRQRYVTEPPATTDEALQHVQYLREPKQIKVWVNQKYPTVMDVAW